MADQKSETPKKSDGKGGYKSLLAGGFGGICVVLSGHPFDTIKVSENIGVFDNDLLNMFIHLNCQPFRIEREALRMILE